MPSVHLSSTLDRPDLPKRMPLLLLLLFMGGCALFRPSEEPATDVVAEEAPVGNGGETAEADFDAELDTGANDPDVPDEAAEEIPSMDDIPPEAEGEAAHESASPVAAESAPEEAAPVEEVGDGAPVADAEVVAQPDMSQAPEIMVELSAEERQELETSAREDLSSARERSQRTRTRDDLSEEQLIRLESLDQYIVLAMEALEKDDVRAASSLALKARLLGEELAPD